MHLFSGYEKHFEGACGMCFVLGHFLYEKIIIYIHIFMKKITWPLLFTLGMGAFSPADAKVEHILPFPKAVVSATTDAVLTFQPGEQVTVNGIEGNSSLKRFFEEFGINQLAFNKEGKGGKVAVELVTSIPETTDYVLEGYQNEAYKLEVTSAGIKITAVTAMGVTRAAQTLTQMAEGWASKSGVKLQGVTITDYPSFKLRGYMHDIGRSYMKVDEIKRQIKMLSRFKVNTFHWHLTENQGFRFEVLNQPGKTGLEDIAKINDASTMSRDKGLYYKQKEIREVVDLAREHGITIIPEIDIPGHSHAFTQAFGFDMQKPQALPILKEILRQVAEVFPKDVSPYIDFGADEVTTSADFVKSIADIIHGLGRKAEVWNPINGVNLSQTGTDLHHMWGTRGKALVGKPNIDSRYNYTNHFDVFADLVGIYKSNIYFEPHATPTVAGAICATWNDRRVNGDDQIMKLNNIYAATIATACRAWQGGGEQYIDNGNNYSRPSDSQSNGRNGGGVTLPNEGKEYDDFKRWEDAFLFHKANALKEVAYQIPYVKQTNVRWRITDQFPNGGDRNMKFPPELAFEAQGDNHATVLPASFNYGGKTYGSGMATGAGIYLSHTWGNGTIHGYYDNPQFGHTAYAWTYVYSDKVQEVGANIEFYNYSRSESNGIPGAGNWDHMGSKIWINGKAVEAPVFNRQDNTGSGKEKLLEDANFAARKPIKVTLNEGWNQVFLKLPYLDQGTRLPKWMFTCVFTDIQGEKAVDGLIYSPSQSKSVEAELVAVKVAELENYRDTQVKDAPGYYQAPEAVAALDAEIKKVTDTFGQQLAAAERKRQVEELNKALEVFKAALAKAGIVMPKASTQEKPVFYTLKADFRDGRFITSKGANAVLMGETAGLKSSCWRFESRSDKTFDIINYDGNYLSPASEYNTAIKAVAEKPERGWQIVGTGTAGSIIFNSGNVELNQTGAAQGYKIYNWSAGGTNGLDKTDAGCRFSINLIEDVADMSMGGYIGNVNAMKSGNVYIFQNQRSGKFLAANAEGTKIVAEGSLQSSDSKGQWVYFVSKLGFKYLYNVKSKKFLNDGVTLNAAPKGHGTQFKATTVAGYPVMFTLNNGSGSLHVDNGGNVINWSSGYSRPEDGGNAYRLNHHDNASAELLQAIETAVDRYEAGVEVVVKSVAELESGAVYTIESGNSAWISVKTDLNWAYGSEKKGMSLEEAKKSPEAQWVYYVSPKHHKYLYNVAAKKFLGGSQAGADTQGLPLTQTPNTVAWKLKNTQKTNDYRIMMSADVNGDGVCHTKVALNNYGLGNWSPGWSNETTDNNCHKFVKRAVASDQVLKDILAEVEKLEGKVEPAVPVATPEQLVEGWYVVKALSSDQNEMQANINANTQWMRTSEEEYKQSGSNYYPLSFTAQNTAKPAVHFLKITKSGGSFYFTALNGHSLNENCTASRGVPAGKTSITGSNGQLQIAHWNTYNAGNKSNVGKYGNNNTKFEIVPARLYAYDQYTVNITGVGNAAEIGQDTRVSCTHPELKSIAKVYDNGVFFVTNGATVTPANFEADRVAGLTAEITVSGKVVTVAYKNDARGNLELKINAAKAKLSGSAEGTEPGNYTKDSRAALQRAIDAAQSVYDKAGSEAAAYNKAVEDLNAAVSAYTASALPVVYSTAEKQVWYYMVSASDQSYCSGKAIQMRENGALTYGEKALDPTMVWSFWKNADGKVAIKNFGGKYMSKTQDKGNAAAGMVASAQYNYTLSHWDGTSVGGAAFTIQSDASSHPIHAQKDNTVIVTWEAGDNNASLWKFVTLTADEVASKAGVTDCDVRLIQTTTGIGNQDVALLRTQFCVGGLNGEPKVNGIKGSVGASAPVEKVKLYRTNNYKEYRTGLEGATLIGEAVPAADGHFDMTFSVPEMLTLGADPYYWLAVDVKADAKEGSSIDAAITGVKNASGELAVANGNPEHQTVVYLTASTVEYMDTHDSKFYRIPALATAQNGWLVAVTDRRFNSTKDLPNAIDVVARISKDNGKTWTEPVVIAGTAETGGTYGHGDPAIVVEKETGDIVVLVVSKVSFMGSTAENPLLIKKIVSHDNGLTWDAPVDITPSLYGKACTDPVRSTYKAAFVGSGSFTQDTDGTLLAAAVVRPASGSAEAHVVTCKNYGTGQEVWTMLNACAIKGADEPKIVVLDNGDWLVKSRARGNSLYAVSKDKGQTWSPQQKWNELVEPSCNGDIIRYTAQHLGHEKNLVLASLPNYVGSAYYYRSNVSIFLSKDDAKTFPVKKSICPNESAYSSLTVLHDGTIGMYFEERSEHPDAADPAYQMRFVRFSLDWLSGGTEKDVYGVCVNTRNAKEKGALATFSAPYATVANVDGVKAFFAAPSAQKASVVMKEIVPETDGKVIVPANTGVLLQTAEPVVVNMIPAKQAGTAVPAAENLLKHTAAGAEKVAGSENAYILSGDETEGAAFFKLSSVDRTIAANRAYLVLQDTFNAEKMSIDFGSITGLEGVEDDVEEDAPIYDLGGRKVAKPAKGGVYIRNGKKFIVK